MGVAAVVRLIGLAWVVLAGLIVGAMLIVSPFNVANVVAASLILGDQAFCL
jgi:hypothetical protein